MLRSYSLFIQKISFLAINRSELESKSCSCELSVEPTVIQRCWFLSGQLDAIQRILEFAVWKSKWTEILGLSFFLFQKGVIIAKTSKSPLEAKDTQILPFSKFCSSLILFHVLKHFPLWPVKWQGIVIYFFLSKLPLF
jgi:hypothetical protein